MGQAEGDAYVGGEAKYYYNNGSYESPAWLEIENCKDLENPDGRTMVPALTKGQWPVIGYLPGARDIGLSWTMLAKKGTVDTALAAMITAYLNGTPVEFASADGSIATAGTKYKRFMMVVGKKDESEPIDGDVTIAFEAKPAVNNGGHAPARQTIGS